MGQRDCITWGEIEIPYIYSFSKRKTISISVHPDLSVSVKAPNDTDSETIRAFVKRKATWISKTRRDFEQFLPRQPERRYISGETHRYLGRQFRLKVENADKDSVKCLRGYLWITTEGDPTPERTKTLLEHWYRQHASTVFKERLLVCHQKVQREGIPMPDLSIRKMVSRWGSFSSKGRITLNLALIKVPKECIDYVIIHELCHFKIKHHGPKFWRLLNQLMPDFEERRKKLNRFAD